MSPPSPDHQARSPDAASLRRLAEALPDPAGLLSEDGTVVYLNSAAADLLQATGADGSATGCYPGWAHALLREESIPVAQQRGAWRGETALCRADLSEVPVEQTLLCWPAGDGMLLLAQWRDLAQSKRATMERIETANSYDAAIRSSGLLFFRWDTTTDSATFLSDPHGLLGIASGEAGSTLDALRERIYPEDRAHFQRELQLALSSRAPLRVDLRLQPSPERVINARLTGGFFLDRDGRLEQFAGFLRAVDHPSHTPAAADQESPPRATAEEAPDAAEYSREVLSRISHELRTPLNAILGFAQLMEMEPATPRQLESLGHISRAGRHLLALVNDVLRQPAPLSVLPHSVVASSAHSASSPAGAPPRRARLLYVEDEVLNVQLVERVLDDYPQYQLTCAGTGMAALEVARQSPPDLVLLDLHLPDISGEDVLSQLKEDPQLRQIPVIMVTADIMGPRVERLLAIGALTYLTKPFRISEFLAVIKDALGPR